MHFPTILLLSLIALSAVLIGSSRRTAWRDRDPRRKDSGIPRPVPAAVAVYDDGRFFELERSNSTEFCLSCHTMESHGRSLYVDDPTYLAAAHFQNHRVPADQACYTCHTNYAMFGGFRAKFNGLHHVYVQYLGKPHDPIRSTSPITTANACTATWAPGRSKRVPSTPRIPICFRPSRRTRSPVFPAAVTMWCITSDN